ncbi:MAG: bifunctional tRNA (5-methylaminomethyl-2-thiouridine)(34)-methyltransferase MnmD/FAD-dependent 5-carboxymethylaminomethyl-2-thiouridine(34) oxidoreductase MnmC [Azoarcus sp.]|nr:bifunctional tRNA (5-methylaminomethyl-2-thiouridine)(34)-methyltransferase MnmD/FAD-dependent 5-carboxymethylaminomethyl-2-thiouridine(34) oxidoreductase MnmC [Azoarcus sp.]
MPITPAQYRVAEDGTFLSDRYDDVYHSYDGGLGQAQHVFLAGNGLPERWRGRRQFVVLETGFGMGLNFLTTWAAWRADPARADTLHFISCELHPFRVEDLIRIHAGWPQFAALADELHARWPCLAPGLHRLHLDEGRVCLTLQFGDAREGLGRILARVDAFMLDGFAPQKNPDLWSARVYYTLARLAAPGATLATWSVAGEVREGLRRAGFVVKKAPGFGGKRQMLRGHYVGRPTRANPTPGASTTVLSAADSSALNASAAGDRAADNPRADDASQTCTRHAIVIGAGVAGCSVAERLAARGWRVELIDAADRPGQGASGNHAGVMRPLPNIDDNRMSRLTRAGALYGWQHVQDLRARGLVVRAQACGVLHLARDPVQEATMRAVVAKLGLPDSLLRFVDADEASRIGDWPVPLGGWWFASSGWVQPPTLCAANLAAHPERIHTHWLRLVDRIEHTGDTWHAQDANGDVIASAPILILAAGTGLSGFPEAAAVPMVSARGQVTLLPATTGSAPRVVICRMGYLSPEVDGVRCAGATFDVDDEDTELRERDQRENLDTLEAMLPGYTARLDPTQLQGRVGFRPASPDRLPMVGALPAVTTLAPGTTLADIPRQPGLYAVSGFGARGLVWAALAGELLAAQLSGEPLPLERDLCEAVDPARYLLRPMRASLSAED